MTKKYTEQELNYIIKNYKTKSNDEIGKELNLTRDAIRKKLKRLGLKKTNEDIKNNYQNNKHKIAVKGIFHPLYKTHRPKDVRDKISKKLKIRTTPYKRKGFHINGKTVRESHIVFCSQPENLHYVPKGFVIHHYDGNALNNSSDNLVMLPRNDHQKLHCQMSKIIRQEMTQ